MKQDFKSFSEFFPHYVSQHSNKTSRILHLIGLVLFFLCLGTAIVTHRLGFVFLAPLCGYGFGWTGHFGFEKNIPASFSHPVWSFFGDCKMALYTARELLTGNAPPHLKQP